LSLVQGQTISRRFEAEAAVIRQGGAVHRWRVFRQLAQRGDIEDQCDFAIA
jgi:hypothetical protein